MDFARRIGKSDEPRIWKRSRTLFVTTEDKLFCEDTLFPEDHSLINWKKWLTDRKKQIRRIETVTGRSQIDQLQSSSEKFRPFIEMKDFMEHAALPIPDKYRGRPGFWKTPQFLPYPDNSCPPKISLTFTRKDLNYLPELMHVGLSDLIAKERNLTELKTKEEPWKRSKYLKLRELELAKEISLLLPKKPEMATLVVQGRAFRKKREPLKRKIPQQRIPLITITEPNEEQSCENADQTILQIQDQEFTWQRSVSEMELAVDPITWSLTFESKINELVEKEIILENKGNHVIVYHWRDSPFRPTNMSFKTRGSLFFFNKTKELILPGQIVKIKVWFRSRMHGIFTESWRLITEPKLSSSAFVFRLWGCAIDTQNTELINYRMIDKYLDRYIRNSTVRSILEEIMADINDNKQSEPVYKTLFLQTELFNSLNPCYFYHPSIATQLQEMYCNVIQNALSWNLSLDTLREILLQIEETNYRRNIFVKFNDFCKQCLRPKSYDGTRNNKNDAVYNILCAFANIFEEESEFLKNNLIREESVIKSKANQQKPIPLSQISNNSSQVTHNKKLIDRSLYTQIQNEMKTFDLNLQLYKEMFFIRIYKYLEESINRASAIIDSCNRLSELEK